MTTVLVGTNALSQDSSDDVALVLEWNQKIPSILTYQEIADACNRALLSVSDNELRRRLVMRRADALHRLRRFAEAAADLRELYERYPDDIEVRWRFVRTLEQIPDQRRRALELAVEMVRNGDRAAYPYQSLGVIAVLREEYEKAIRLFDVAAALEPRHPMPYQWRALAHLKTGQRESAVQDAHNALLLLPSSGELFGGKEQPEQVGFGACAVLTVAFAQQGLEEDALRSAHLGMRFMRESSGAFHLLWIALDAGRMDASCRRICHEWLKRFPRDRLGHLAYAITLTNSGRPKAAQETAEKGLTFPVNSDTLLTLDHEAWKGWLGWNRAVAGEFAAASKYLREATHEADEAGKNGWDAKLRLAFLLATCPETAVRDGADAMKLVREFVEQKASGDYCDQKVAVLKIVEAVAAAECEEWPVAIAACKTAISLVVDRPELRNDYEGLLKLIERREPYRHYGVNDERFQGNLLQLRAGLIFE